MAYIDNSETKKEMNDAIRGNSVSNIAPTKINDSVQPVININPKDYRRVNIVKRVGTAATVYTTPTDKDFYLVAFNISAGSLTAGTNTWNLSATIDGDSSATALAYIYLEITAGTSSQDSTSQNFKYPIKIARGTNITTSGAGTFSGRSCTIYGYTVEP